MAFPVDLTLVLPVLNPVHAVQSMAGAPIAADGSKGLGPLLAGWDGDLADAAPESQAQRAAPVTAGVDVLKILSACGQ